MRIALVGARCYPSRHGGLEVAVEAISRELASRGHLVDVYVSEAFSLAPPLISLHTNPAIRQKYLHTISQVLLGMRAVSKSGADVVHIHGVGPALPLAISKKAFGDMPVIVTAHGLDWDRDKWPAVARRVFRLLGTQASRRASRLTSVSSHVSEQLRDMTGRDVHTISNGVDVTGIDPSASSIVEFGRYSVCVSRLTPEKNIRELIREYDKSVSDVHGPLVIVGGGSGSYSSQYERELKDYARDRHIVFTGPLPHGVTLGVAENADRFISLSKLEAQPIAVMEAMALGTPLYLSDIPQHVELCGAGAQYVGLSSGTTSLRSLLLADAICDRERVTVAAATERLRDCGWASVATKYELIYNDVYAEFHYGKL